MICECCKKENEYLICDACREALIEKAKESDMSLEDIFIDALSGVPSPQKEYGLIDVFRRRTQPVRPSNADWFIANYPYLSDTYWENDFEKNEIKAWTMLAYFSKYEYDKAEEIAAVLRNSDNLSSKAYIALAEFLYITRRYEDAMDLLNAAGKRYKAELAFDECYSDLWNKVDLFRNGGDGKHREYIPNPRENKEEVKKKYIEFVQSVTGNRPRISTASIPKPISKDAYPVLNIVSKPNFDSFVAFDFETTGLDSKKDAIIEIGAVKVLNGKVLATKNYTFQEFVKPLKAKLSPNITKLTGIEPGDVEDARPIWEVFPDFMNFAGDLPLIGYNNKNFDNGFLIRAGRYSKLIVTNKNFDVYIWAKALQKKGVINPAELNLTSLSNYLHIKNPQAHRALADAVTTAKVFMKLKDL